MGQPLSMDLRSWVLAALNKGMSCRAAAARFGVAPSTAIRWVTQRLATGSFEPKPQDGDMRSQRVEQLRDKILSIWDTRKDITLDEPQAASKEAGLTVSRTSLHRFVARHGITRKKDWARDRARSLRHAEVASNLVRWPD